MVAMEFQEEAKHTGIVGYLHLTSRYLAEICPFSI